MCRGQPPGTTAGRLWSLSGQSGTAVAVQVDGSNSCSVMYVSGPGDKERVRVNWTGQSRDHKV